jgi:hypothetical protein
VQPSRDPVADYLAALDDALRRRRVPGRSIRHLSRELCDHLERESERWSQRGLTAAAARRQAVASFGDAAELAAEWASVDRRWPPRLIWGLLSAAGMLLGLACGIPAGLAVAPWIGMMLLLPVIGGVAGSCLGLGQWAVLRRYWSGAGIWVPGTAAALAVGLQAATVIVEGLGMARRDPLQESLALMLTGLVIGALVGLVQWRSLSRHGVGGGWWIMANALGLAAGLAVGGRLAVLGFGDFRGPEGLATLALFGALTMGMATSFALAPVFEDRRSLLPG